MHVFYTPDIAVCNELPAEEAGHCLRVLRLGMGDEVMLTDGKGWFLWYTRVDRFHWCPWYFR